MKYPLPSQSFRETDDRKENTDYADVVGCVVELRLELGLESGSGFELALASSLDSVSA